MITDNSQQIIHSDTGVRWIWGHAARGGVPGRFGLPLDHLGPMAWCYLGSQRPESFVPFPKPFLDT